MPESEFVAYYAVFGPNEGWYSTVRQEGIQIDREDWATRYDPLLFGPFESREEAEQAIDDALRRSGIDLDALVLAAKHADESLEADREYYPGGELAKRRFQVALRSFAENCAKGNPPAEVVGLGAGYLIISMCAAYPTVGNEVFRRIGNLFRQELEIPELEYGERPEYDD